VKRADGAAGVRVHAGDDPQDHVSANDWRPSALARRL